MTPLVSVVIPTYNRAHLIEQAIDSVLEQPTAGVEIIVVDDGSSDGTEARVRRYGDRVRFIRAEHGGVARARNIGSREARGRFLTYLDSDDRHYPYTLALQTALLERLPDVAFVCAEMSGFDDRGFFERYHLKAYHRSAYRDPAVTYERMFQRSMRLAETCPVPSALAAQDPRAGERRVYVGNVFDWYLVKLILAQNTVMVRREVLAEAGERNERLKYWEGVDLLLRICRRRDICFVDVPTYQLRYHDGQISGTSGSDGKYVWMRKQQGLLRVTRRHVLADPDYYRRHRASLDRHLANLHRAAAVPMLLSEGDAPARMGYARRARRYLARCARYGHAQRTLWAVTFLPGPMRRLLVTVVERLRGLRVAWAARPLAA